MNKSTLILGIIIICGSIFHGVFLSLNEVLKVADSFAYLQMSSYIRDLSQAGLGNGWFGFVYSLPLALSTFFIGQELIAAQITNLILFGITAILLWKISRKTLSIGFSYFVIILLYLSPTLLHFNIHVLSENTYIPLFLAVFLMVSNFIEASKNIPSLSLRLREQQKYVIIIACFIGLMYLTRAEAFIYLSSIGLVSFVLLYQKVITFGNFMRLGSIFFITFFLFISPYLFHLHSLTGEWGLTNKGASNLRQAELRGIDHMDDIGFEQAVGELTSDKTQLIAGFAGGMEYVRPQIEGSLSDFISRDPKAFLSRVIRNQQKLFTKNLPEIYLGKSPQLYYSDDVRFSNIFFLIFCSFPIIILLFGIYNLYREQKIFLGVSTAFFLPALIFFTLFFTLNRYFLIFLPLLLMSFVYGLYSLRGSLNNIMGSALVSYFLIGNIVSIFLLSISVYYNTESPKDEYYELKKEAGIWLSKNEDTNLKIMERFPIVTYYSGTKTRYITPYTSNITDIQKYAQYNNLDILVVDTMDFQTYRPGLLKYLENTPDGFSLLRTFENEKGQKVILYELKK